MNAVMPADAQRFSFSSSGSIFEAAFIRDELGRLSELKVWRGADGAPVNEAAIQIALSVAQGLCAKPPPKAEGDA
jgi:hypothetical protein